jgi:isopentenyl-diphosphate Delta-isomerase
LVNGFRVKHGMTKKRIDIARKSYQLQIPLSQNVSASSTNGFENFHFVHNPLPEIDFEEIDISCTFLGKKLSSPFLISSMTGGSKELGVINEKLASAAGIAGIAMGVGSERVLIESEKKYKKDKTLKKTHHEILNSFSVRKSSSLPLFFGNLGAIQLNNKMFYADVKHAKELIDADAMFLHLNSLQEAVQKNGNTNFEGLIEKIGEIMAVTDFSIIVKEVGNGLSRESILKLKKVGVKYFDLAGAGGTSWVKIECLKRKENEEEIDFIKVGEDFKNWGNKTVQILENCQDISGITLIASGGVRSGVEAAKAIALGASLVGFGLPFLKQAGSSVEGIVKYVKTLEFELKLAMFSVGAKNLEELKKTKLIKN